MQKHKYWRRSSVEVAVKQQDEDVAASQWRTTVYYYILLLLLYMCPHAPYWVLQVTVKQEDQDVDVSEKGPDFRLYAVAPSTVITPRPLCPPLPFFSVQSRPLSAAVF